VNGPRLQPNAIRTTIERGLLEPKVIGIEKGNESER
jgi:hypothetical protein